MYFQIESELKVSCGVEETVGDDKYDLLQFEPHNHLRKYLPYFHIQDISSYTASSPPKLASWLIFY